MRKVHLETRLIVVLAVVTLAWWVRYHPPGVDLIVMDDDARQHVFWTARFQDPELFQDDLLTEFISSVGIAPLGYQLVYRMGVQFLDPLPLSQILSLILLVLSLFGLEALLNNLGADKRGRTFSLILFSFYSLYDSSGGLPRGFAFPSLIWFLVFYVRENALGQGLVVFLQSVFYPPILLNSVALAALGMVRSMKREGWGWKGAGKIAPIALSCFLSLGFLIFIYGGFDTELWGSQVSVEEAKSMPEFHEDGRSKFFRDNLLDYFLLGRSGIGITRIIGFITIVIGMVLFGGRGVFTSPKIAWELTWTSLVLFILAHLLLFKLHLPSRYTMYTLPLALLLTIGKTTAFFVQSLEKKWAGTIERVRNIPKPVGLCFLLLGLAAYCFIQGHFILTRDTQVATVDRVEKEMLAFLETLPKSSLIAGHPNDMNDVPIISKRKVLANQELSLPYHRSYYNKVKERIFDFFKAYYAESWEEIESFVEKYGITALVVNKVHFANGHKDDRIYFEPFNSFVRELIKGREHFILSSPPREMVCFENDRYMVLCWKQKLPIMEPLERKVPLISD